jgi:hypothetical protein
LRSDFSKNIFASIIDANDSVFETHIQILIEKSNGTNMKENKNVIEYVNKLVAIAKEMDALGNSYKLQPYCIVCLVH